MSSQAEGAVADVTAETLAVEEVTLSAESLHHVHPLGAEVADIAAAHPGREVLTRHARWSIGPVVRLIEDGQYLSFGIYG